VGVARDAPEIPPFKGFQTLADPQLGTKQVCPNCQAKFYDLTRRPAHCPKCDTEFDPEEAIKLRSRRGRPGGYASDDAEDQVVEKKVDGDEDEEDEAVSTPEIDQEGHEPILTPDDDDDTPADASEEAGMGTTDGDDEDVLADDDDDSVPFIEDEDDDAFGDDVVKPNQDED
jgi:uncharacterized protein (TIGR02300 family)